MKTSSNVNAVFERGGGRVKMNECVLSFGGFDLRNEVIRHNSSASKCDTALQMPRWKISVVNAESKKSQGGPALDSFSTVMRTGK
jgi:hypothetical protein